METSISVNEIIGSIQDQCCVRGSRYGYVRYANPIDKADGESLSFCRFTGEQALNMIRGSGAKVIICSNDLDLLEEDYRDKTLIQVSTPRLTFSRLLTKFFLIKPKLDIHPSSIIDGKSRIGHGVHIGPLCHIGDCEIGDGTFIEGQVYIHDGTKIGKSVIIHPGVVIGTEAISFVRNEKKELEWFPQLGGIIIEDNVEIGANTVIARGPLPQNDTIIGEGTKLDILIEVGHGVRIGKHCLIIGHTIMAGRVKIGDYTQISGQVSIKEGVTVGSRALVGMGSVVLKDVPDDIIVIGSPARELRRNVL